MTIKQSNAVVNAVEEVLGTWDAETPISEQLSKEQLTEIRQIVFNGIMDETIAYSKELDEVAVRKYVGGLVNNHFRKHKSLNGGSTYQASGTGRQRDPQLKELNKIIKAGLYEEGSEEYECVVEKINERQEILAKEKSSKKIASSMPKININELPEELRHLV